MSLPECLCPHHKAFNKHVCPCGEALAIAWEALESIKDNKRDLSVYRECEEALRRIKELGEDASPKEGVE